VIVKTFTTTAGKVFSRDLLRQQTEIWRSQGLTVVMTNGCFDLLHAGHIATLETARSMGNVLIVAVNSDAIGGMDLDKFQLRLGSLCGAGALFATIVNLALL